MGGKELQLTFTKLRCCEKHRLSFAILCTITSKMELVSTPSVCAAHDILLSDSMQMFLQQRSALHWQRRCAALLGMLLQKWKQRTELPS
jgi:hypothetical protein